MMRIGKDGGKARRRLLLLVAMPTLLLSSAVVASAPSAGSQANTWTQTTRDDFSGGKEWNVDVDSDPGNVTLLASATSWIESSFNPGLRAGPSGSWDDSGIASPVVLKEKGIYRMWYAGDDTGSGKYRIGYAISSDGVNWTKPKLGLVMYNGNFNNNIVLDLGGNGTWENVSLMPGTILHDGTGYRLWYTCSGTSIAICLAQSADGLTWSRSGANPVLGGLSDPEDHLSPAVIHEGSLYTILFAIPNSFGHYGIWMATSADGISWAGEARVKSMTLGEAGSWYDGGTVPGTVLNCSGSLQMWYSGYHGPTQEIGMAVATDGGNWSASRLNPLLRLGAPGTWDSVGLSRPSVMRDDQRFRMWFAGFDGVRWSIGTAASAFGDRPLPPKTNPVVPLGNLESWDSGGMFRPSVLFKDGTYHMWYTGSTSRDGSTGLSIGYARSVDGVEWEKPIDTPVLRKDPLGWDKEWVGFAWVMWDNSSSMFRMWFTGSDGVSNRIGMATSPDGLSWQKDPSNPVTLIGNLTWFNPSDTRCPWVGENPDRFVMYAGTRGPTNVSIARLSSWDRGQTWLGDETPFLTPRPSSWEGDSVSCPTLAKNETGQTQWIWYEGSSGTGIPGFGGIGLLVSDFYGYSFRRASDEPVLKAAREWDSGGVGAPSVVRKGTRLRMWFNGDDGRSIRIGVANSYDGLGWHEFLASPALCPTGTSSGLSSPAVFDDGYALSMFLASNISGRLGIFLAWQSGSGWQTSPVSFLGPIGTWDIRGRKPLAAFRDGATYHLWYAGMNSAGQWSVGHASSFNPVEFQPSPLNPVLVPGSSMSWDSEGIDSADVIHPGLTHPYEMWYSGFDGATWRIGFAFSNDGERWTKSVANPVLHPSPIASWDYAGVSNPRVLKEGGMYHMLYSGYDGGGWSLGHAFSENGIAWTRSRLNPLLGGQSPGQDRIVVRESSIWKSDSGYGIWFSDTARTQSAIGFVQTPFLSVGTLISVPVDSGMAGTQWRTANLTARTSSLAKIGNAYRTGHPAATWSDWSSDLHSSSMQPQVPRGMQLQYRATLISVTGESSPVMEEISGEYAFNDAPAAQPRSPGSGICTNDRTPLFTWDYVDAEEDLQNGVFFEVANETAFVQPYISTYLATGVDRFTPGIQLPDGIWYWRVRVVDAFLTLGPWSVAAEFCVDTVPPSTDLALLGPSLGSAPTYVSGTTQVSFNMVDTGSGRGVTWLRLDVGAWQPYSVPFAMSAGHHTISYNSTDEAGNKDSTQTRDFWVDVTPPSTSLIADSSSVSRNGVLYLTGNMALILASDDAESGHESSEYAIDGVLNWISGSIVQSIPPGPHTLYFRSTDGVGNFESVNAQSLLRDDMAPETTLVIGGPSVQGSPIHVASSTWFNLTATDGGVGVNGTYYRIGGGQPYRYVGNFSIAGEGAQALEYYSVDDLGNVERRPALNIEVDTQGPATYPVFLGPSFQGSTASYVRSNTAIMFTGVDNSSDLQRIMYCLDGGQWIRYNSPFALASPGLHTVSFYGIDVLGNTEPPKTMDVIVDDQSPTTTLTLVGQSAQHGGVTYIDTSTTAALTADDAGSGVFLTKYRLDGGTWNVYNKPITLAGAGTRMVEIQSVDNIGNVEMTQLFTFVVDAAPPVADAGQDVALFAPATVTLDALGSTDDTLILGYEWVLESNGSVALRTPRGAVSVQSPGTYTFTVSVRDPLGRESRDSMTVKVLQNPDSDKDTLPDVWEMERFGNLTYGPGDDPDGDGVTNIKEYGREGGDDSKPSLDTIPTAEGDQTGDVLVLAAMVLLGVLAGVAVLQYLKIRELRMRLDGREAEASIGFEEEEGEVPR